MERDEASPQTDDELVHDLDSSIDSKIAFFSKKTIPIFAVIVLLGIGSGFLGASLSKGSGILLEPTSGAAVDGGEKTVFGIEDDKTFTDQAQGLLVEGGIDGEGEYHLERAGGESQNVYLTSSTIDLSEFIDKKIKVWGETFSAKKAGWLMDVGKLEVL